MLPGVPQIFSASGCLKCLFPHTTAKSGRGGDHHPLAVISSSFPALYPARARTAVRPPAWKATTSVFLIYPNAAGIEPLPLPPSSGSVTWKISFLRLDQRVRMDRPCRVPWHHWIISWSRTSMWEGTSPTFNPQLPSGRTI